MITVLIVYMLFASTFTFGKMALFYAEPIFFIGARMITAGILLLSYQHFFNQNQWKFHRDSLWLYGQIIFFHIYFAFVLEFWALKYMTSSKACLIYNLSPFITALYSYLLFSERMDSKKWLGLSVGFCGLLPILFATSPLENQSDAFLHISLPEWALFGAVACSAYGWIVMKKLIHREHSFVMVNGIGMFGGGILAFVTSLIIEGTPMLKMPAKHNELDILALKLFSDGAPVALFITYMLLLILIANVICYNLYGYLLHKHSATFLSFAGFTTPLFAALFGWMFMGESISLPFIASAMLTFLGLYIFYAQESKKA